MKPFYLLLIALILCCTSCVAQDLEVKPESEIKLDLIITSICEDKTTLYHRQTGKFLFTKGGEDLTLGREYTVVFSYFDDRNKSAFKRKILIKNFVPSKRQNSIDRSKL